MRQMLAFTSTPFIFIDHIILFVKCFPFSSFRCHSIFECENIWTMTQSAVVFAVLKGQNIFKFDFNGICDWLNFSICEIIHNIICIRLTERMDKNAMKKKKTTKKTASLERLLKFFATICLPGIFLQMNESIIAIEKWAVPNIWNEIWENSCLLHIWWVKY